MYKVIIVDDEAISRIGIQGIIDWEANGFTIVGLAANGREALELIEKEEPDVVFTDVKMPVMSGLELIKVSKEKDIDSDFFIISAHDEFAFLKEAMKFGARDYIIKNNLKPEVMIELLEKYKKTIELKEPKARGNDDSVINREILDEARRYFLKSLLYGKRNIEEINETVLSQYQLDLSKPNILVMLIKGDNASDDDAMKMISSIVEDLSQDHEGLYYCQTGYEEISLLYNFNRMSNTGTKEHITMIAEQFDFVIKQYLNVNVTIYISDCLEGYQQIPLAYLQVCQINNNYYIQGSVERLVFYENVEIQRLKVSDSKIEKALRYFKKGLDINDHEEIIVQFNQLISNIESAETLSRSQLQYYLSAFLYILKEYVLQKSLFEVERMITDVNYENANERNSSIENCIKLLISIRISLEKTFKDSKDQSLYVRRINSYLQKYYTEKICLEDLARHIGLSYAYMSSLYKKETGENIRDYIIELRINKAKKQLETTNLPIYTVAVNVGYDNEHYFSRLFKQRTGISPSSYRQEQL